MPPILTVKELAEFLRMSVNTVKADVLPPRMKIPGSRRVLWRRIDVERWMEDKVQR
jgi:predicted DNA-binding transcriptional regulator AlpA